MIVALYVLVTLSLVFAQRCLRPEQDAPSINQIDLAVLSLHGTAFCSHPLDKHQANEFGEQAIDDCDATVSAGHSPLRIAFAHIDEHRAPQGFGVHIHARLPTELTTTARSRAPPALLT